MNKSNLIVSLIVLIAILGFLNPRIVQDTQNWPYILMPLAMVFLIARSHLLEKIRSKDILLAAFPWIIGGLATFAMISFEKTKQEAGRSGDLQTVTIAADASSHFHVEANVNKTATIHFLVDTGASRVVLTKKDAQALGINLNDLVFNQVTSTANGSSVSAPITLDSVEIEGIRLTKVKASVARGDLDVSLLGQSFLNRLHSFEVSQGQLQLRG